MAKHHGIQKRRTFIKEVKDLCLKLRHFRHVGKNHKPYEYGTKASIVSTANGSIIFSAVSYSENIHDSKTLDEVIEKAHAVRQTTIQTAVCDRSYVGVKEVRGVKIMLAKKALKRGTRYQRDKKRQMCRQLAAI